MGVQLLVLVASLIEGVRQVADIFRVICTLNGFAFVDPVSIPNAAADVIAFAIALRLTLGMSIAEAAPVRAAWMDMAVLSGVLVLDDYAQKRRQYLRTRWVPQGWAYIQPVQDVQARRMEVQAGFSSRSEMVLRTGYDAETVDLENAADLARATKLGLNYNTLDAVEDNDDKEQP